ncbi:MAG: AAA family ATPase [Bacteroidota bacterium]|nr:AAA family ATPase [Bacteroidota bacterium]
MEIDNGLGLHLPSLRVRNFRGIEDLSIQRLGRINLIAGRNGVGKTTILEAAWIFARRGAVQTLEEVLQRHNELLTALDENHEALVVPDYAALFHGRTVKPEDAIVIGPVSSSASVRIQLAKRGDLPEQDNIWPTASGWGNTVDVLKVSYNGHESLYPVWPGDLDPFEPVPSWHLSRFSPNLGRKDRASTNHVLKCESLGPGLPSNYTMANYLDAVTVMGVRESAVRSLRLIDDRVEDANAVGESDPRYLRRGRRILVTLRDIPIPVSLNSLGDGIIRLFAAALAVARSRGGLLVIDEIENGIHYTVQQDFWEMIIKAAMDHNVQVFATTHSFDCVRGFAAAAEEFERDACALVRIDRFRDGLKAIEYPPEDLEAAAVQGIEVR